MAQGSALRAMRFFDARRVIENEDRMGRVGTALASVERSLVAGLGSKDTPAQSLRPGPLTARLEPGIVEFDELLDMAAERAQNRSRVAFDSVGVAAAHLITGGAADIDGGRDTMG